MRVLVNVRAEARYIHIGQTAVHSLSAAQGRSPNHVTPFTRNIPQRPQVSVPLRPETVESAVGL